MTWAALLHHHFPSHDVLPCNRPKNNGINNHGLNY
jgi:hypothetical protein